MRAVERLLRAVAPLQRRVLLMLSRAVVRVVDDSRAVQELQLSLLRDELRAGVERLQEYGFTSVPLPGAWAFAACIGGNRDHPVVIATDDGRHRPRNLQPGEVALYDHSGQVVHLKADGQVRIQATAALVVDAPQSSFLGNVAVQGTVIAQGVIQSASSMVSAGNVIAFNATPAPFGMGIVRDTFNAHTHPENDAGGPTAPPNTPVPA